MPVAQPRRAPQKAEQAGDRVLHFAQILVGAERARDDSCSRCAAQCATRSGWLAAAWSMAATLLFPGERAALVPMTDAPSAVKEAIRPRGRLDSAKASEMALEMSCAVNPGSSLYARVAVFASKAGVKYEMTAHRYLPFSSTERPNSPSPAEPGSLACARPEERGQRVPVARPAR